MGILVASPTKTSCATPLPVPKGKDLGHAFGLNRGYVYGEVARENLAFVPVLPDRGWDLPPPLYQFIAKKNNLSKIICGYF